MAKKAMLAAHKHQKLRLQASALSLVVSLVIFALKFYSYHLTHSMAIFSDALESVVNIAAAFFTLYAVNVAEDPPDAEHPYGHGKFEFITAVFEGGLICFAGLIIAFNAIRVLLNGTSHPNLTTGLTYIAVAGALNGLLGFFLLQTGRKTNSLAIVGDAKHVLADFATSVAVLLGLGIVKWTGLNWIDPVIALLLAILLAATGIPLVRVAISGLIDAADPALLKKLLQALEEYREPGLIRVHHVRAMRNGRQIHVDGHLVMPEFWPVEKAHDYLNRFSEEISKHALPETELEFHVDPCRRVYCRSCDLLDCPIRTEKFQKRPPLSLEELTSPVDITDIRRA